MMEKLKHQLSDKRASGPVKLTLDVENTVTKRNGKLYLDPFEPDNTLVMVGMLDDHGNETIVNDNDVINIIPIIHGGTSSRIQLKLFSTNIEIFEMKKTFTFDNTSLNKLRMKFPNLVIQAISSKFLLNKSHIKKIISLSLLAKKHKTMLSKKLETDILLRFAGTTQINYAIEKAGLNSKSSFCIIAIGKKSLLEKLHNELNDGINNTPLRVDNSHFLKKYFKISKKHIDSIDSNFSLEDLLVERSSILT